MRGARPPSSSSGAATGWSRSRAARQRPRGMSPGTLAVSLHGGVYDNTGARSDDSGSTIAPDRAGWPAPVAVVASDRGGEMQPTPEGSQGLTRREFLRRSAFGAAA